MMAAEVAAPEGTKRCSARGCERLVPVGRARTCEVCRAHAEALLLCPECGGPRENLLGRRRPCEKCAERLRGRRCKRCREWRHASDFVPGGVLCPGCREDGHPMLWRACFWCLEHKPPRAFPWGDGRKARGPEPAFQRRRHVCQECLDRREEERDEERAARVRTWEQDGRLVRRCSGCGEVKDLEHGFYNERAPDPAKPMERQRGYRCKACTARRTTEQKRRQAADPERGAVVREQRREWQRAWRAANPDAYHENQRAWFARKMQDPEWAERYRENERLAYRLRRLRLGLAVRDSKVPQAKGPRLPAPPLLAAVDRLVEAESRSLYGVPEAPSIGDGRLSPTETVCLRLGISARSMSRWRTGESRMVSFEVADGVLVKAGLFWWDVWNEETADSEELALVERAFSGEQAAA